MDKNLMQGIVMLGFSDRSEIPRDVLVSYIKNYFADSEYPYSLIQMYELICQIVQTEYNDEEIRDYCRKVFSIAGEIFGKKFSEEEMDLLLDSCSVRQASHRSVNIFKLYPDVVERLKKSAAMLPQYAEADDLAMFYFAYKLNSYLIRAALQAFPEEKSLCYEIVARMNKYQSIYDKIEFVGKDKDNV